MEKTVYTLNQFADKVGVTPQTLRVWHKEGKLTPAFITDGGHRRYTHKQYLDFVGKNKGNYNSKVNIGYVRVSSKKQSDDLIRQAQLMESYLVSKGKPFKLIQSIGSSINYKNPNLHELIRMVINNEVDTVYVLYKDRLVRFGFELLEFLFHEFGVSIEVVNQQFETAQEELVTDLIQIITVFSAKLNGKRKNKVQNFKKDLEDD
jgi:transposon, resolvase